MHFIDLFKQQKRIREKIENNIKKVLDHGRYILGPEVGELEEKLADYVGVKYAVGAGSGTDALLMALMAQGVGSGDAVYTSVFTFIATAEVIRLSHATPVFVDIDPLTYNLCPRGLKKAIEKTEKEGKLKSRGIIPVDIFGQCADYAEINTIARQFNLFVLQDAAQSFGASYKGKKACSNAEIAATSFFPAKPLGCYGDGGMVFTENQSLYEKLISIRVHGMGIDKYENVRVGLNARIDTIQASILLAKMEIFKEELEQRQEVADRYSETLAEEFTVPVVLDHNKSAWAQYSIQHPDRDLKIQQLKERKIPAAIYYPIPLHLQKVFSYLEYQKGDFPVSESISSKIFSIPMHPYLNADQQQEVTDILNS